MRYIAPYQKGSVPTFSGLVAHFDPAIQVHLNRLAPQVGAAHTTFVANIPDVHRVKAISLSETDKEILLDAYKKKPAAITQAFEAMRDSLKPEDKSLCPFCNLSEECELDHFLPKKKYPEYSLFPPNLVPICSKCNKKKAQVVKDRRGRRVMVYPFHELNGAPVFLDCKISLGKVAGLSYDIVNKYGMDVKLFELMERHFVRVGLKERLGKRGNAALQTFVLRLKGMSEKTIKETLLSMANTVPLSCPKNYWHSALHVELGRISDAFAKWHAATY